MSEEKIVRNKNNSKIKLASTIKTDKNSEKNQKFNESKYSKESLEKLSKEELINLFLKANIQEQKNTHTINNLKSIAIPITLFEENIAPLEGIIRYLIEVEKLSFNDVAKLLNRNFKTVWATYNNSKNKKIVFRASNIKIPIEVFLKESESEKNNGPNKENKSNSNKGLSILESLTKYLHEEYKFTFKEISKMICRNIKTVYTVYNRAISKNNSGNTLNNTFKNNAFRKEANKNFDNKIRRGI